MASYVGIDLHRRRSVIVVMDEAGERGVVVSDREFSVNLETELRSIIDAAGGEPVEVVIEATWGWYWAADVVEACGAGMHLAHPLGIKAYDNRRVKTDYNDAVLLADLLRMNRLPESWVAPPAIRELRELVRYRRKLAQLQTGLKAQVHQTLGKEGEIPPTKSIWWSGRARWLDDLQLADAYTNRVESLRDLLALYHREITSLDGLIHREIRANTDLADGYETIQTIGGVGRVLAAVFCVEIGDVHRFPNPRRLASWAGMTPEHKESDTTLHRKQITKQGSVLVRWAAVEAVTGSTEAYMKSAKRQVGERRGLNIGKVAAARQLLTLVFYGLRDGEIRCLQSSPAQALRDHVGRGRSAFPRYGITSTRWWGVDLSDWDQTSRGRTAPCHPAPGLAADVGMPRHPKVGLAAPSLRGPGAGHPRTPTTSRRDDPELNPAMASGQR